MKISITLGAENEDMMFDKITVITKEKSISQAYCTIKDIMNEVSRYYDESDILEIKLWRYKL